MAYQFQRGQMYRMPTHFGPATGPRRGPYGGKFSWKNEKALTLAVSFLTNPAALDALLPPGFTLAGEPVVTVAMTCLTELEWLAGRGYNVLGVSFPATVSGVTGSFLSVLWENLADPIITGREELGFSKVFCDLPEPTLTGNGATCSGSWMGFKFLDMELTGLQPADAPAPGNILHYKYVPRTGDWGTADIAYPVITPAATPARVVEHRRGTGKVKFHRARWEDMPTQYMIVNAFEALPVNEWRGASLTRTVGGKDLSDQRILRPS